MVDVQGELVIDAAGTALKSHVIEHLDDIAAFCGVDVFLLGPKFPSPADDLTGNVEAGRDQRWRVAIYGDVESAEHAKTRVLILIDRLVGFSRPDAQAAGANGSSLDALSTACFSNFRCIP